MKKAFIDLLNRTEFPLPYRVVFHDGEVYEHSGPGLLDGPTAYLRNRKFNGPAFTMHFKAKVDCPEV